MCLFLPLFAISRRGLIKDGECGHKELSNGCVGWGEAPVYPPPFNAEDQAPVLLAMAAWGFVRQELEDGTDICALAKQALGITSLEDYLGNFQPNLPTDYNGANGGYSSKEDIKYFEKLDPDFREIDDLVLLVESRLATCFVAHLAAVLGCFNFCCQSSAASLDYLVLWSMEYNPPAATSVLDLASSIKLVAFTYVRGKYGSSTGRSKKKQTNLDDKEETSRLIFLTGAGALHFPSSLPETGRVSVGDSIIKILRSSIFHYQDLSTWVELIEENMDIWMMLLPVLDLLRLQAVPEGSFLAYQGLGDDMQRKRGHFFATGPVEVGWL
nr:hypothetical protein Iba_chr09dCG9010 [Ipomoea batatas]